MIPKLSAPLVKDIRTGEGVAEWALALGLVVLGACSDLSWAHSATFLTILAGVKGARRGLLKVVALQQGAGIGPPLEPGVLVSATGVIHAGAEVAETVAPAGTAGKVAEGLAAGTASPPGGTPA